MTALERIPSLTRQVSQGASLQIGRYTPRRTENSSHLNPETHFHVDLDEPCNSVLNVAASAKKHSFRREKSHTHALAVRWELKKHVGIIRR
jgi:hypothetical protein